MNNTDEMRTIREALRLLLRTPRGESRQQEEARYRERNRLQERLNELAQLHSPGAHNSKIERRAFGAEVRAKGRRLEGYAATFGQEARIADFIETIQAGAFADSLAERADILALVDHDRGRLLARTRSKTLRLAEDSRGLAFDLDVPPTTVGSDVLALAERGDLGGMSFGFTVKADRWDGERRTLEAVDLREISIVSSWPAYPETVVQARARPAEVVPIHTRVHLARRYLDSL